MTGDLAEEDLRRMSVRGIAVVGGAGLALIPTRRWVC